MSGSGFKVTFFVIKTILYLFIFLAKLLFLANTALFARFYTTTLSAQSLGVGTSLPHVIVNTGSKNILTYKQWMDMLLVQRIC